MNKIFHARVVWYHYLSLIVLTGGAIWGLWQKDAFLGVFGMIGLIGMIEKIIHSTYTVTTDGQLIIYEGRFYKKRKIAIKDINSIKKDHTMNFRNFHCAEFILIQYSGEKYLTLIPVKEQEFIDLINNIRTNGCNF